MQSSSTILGFDNLLLQKNIYLTKGFNLFTSAYPTVNVVIQNHGFSSISPNSVISSSGYNQDKK